MENKAGFKSFLPVAIIFVVSSLFIVVARQQLADARFDYRVLLVGNVLLFGVTAVSFSLYAKALRNANPHAFVRMMYGSLLVKMFVCLLATFIYAWFAGRSVSRNAIFGCFGLYIVYTWLEVKILMQLSKKSPKNV
ncbi:hypothetical protein [Puia sp.]|jgi:hypothetical protein|uniref:hypothetical protein n=1 Tax=Puia sp. TaxID=2045100 RepID=UPI002F424CC4